MEKQGNTINTLCLCRHSAKITRKSHSHITSTTTEASLADQRESESWNGEKSRFDRNKLPGHEGGAERMHKRRVEDAPLPHRSIRFLRRRHHRFDRHGRVLHGAHGEEHPVSVDQAGPIGEARGHSVRPLQRTRHAPPRGNRRG